MKICKQCLHENQDMFDICESCGAELEAAAEESVAAEEAVAVEEAAMVEESEVVEEPVVEEKPAKKKHGWLQPAIIAVLAAGVVLTGFAAGKALYTRAHKGEEPGVQEPAAAPDEQEAENEVIAGEVLADPISSGHHLNAYGFASHSLYYNIAEDGTASYYYMNEAGETVSVSAEDAAAMMAQEVASCGDLALTNDIMMFYYDEQVYSFESNYSSYLSLLINMEKPLDEQMYQDGVNTWEQSFIGGSLQMFQQVAAIHAEALAAGYEMTEDEQAMVDQIVASMDEAGASYGFESGDAYMQAYFGPLASVEAYKDYYEQNIYANSYLTHIQENMTYTEEELNQFYEENEALLNSYGIIRSDKNVVNIRHILIKPLAHINDDGTTSISDEAWAEAEAKAQSVYEAWLAGEATEESFAALAEEFTEDPGSMTTGGLYEEVFPGRMLEEFDAWCFADGRAAGDHGIVKTTAGYHIMFFSSEGDYIYWRQPAGEMLKRMKTDEYAVEVTEKYELISDTDKVVLLSRMAPTVPGAEEEAAEAE